MDVTDRDAVDALPQAVTQAQGTAANILINNAGVALGGTFAEVKEADFDWLMNINLHAPIRLTRAFLPQMQDMPAAHIINVSSLFGLIAPAGQVAYATSKFGLRGFSEAMRHELVDGPVGVTVVHPGGVSTAIARNARNSTALPTEDAEDELRKIESMLTMPPDQAAALIVDALKRRAPRVLVGKDAKLLDIIQRLMPGTYWARVRKQFGA